MENETYDKAVVRVKRIKGFYRHLFIYLVFLVLWFVFAPDLLRKLGVLLNAPEIGVPTFVNINMWLNPLIWGTVILLHGVFVFGYQHPWIRRWENRKLTSLMEEESAEKSKHIE